MTSRRIPTSRAIVCCTSPNAAEHGRGVTTRVARARYEDGRLHDLRVIFTALPASQRGHHFGSRLLFDRAGMLYVSVGDRGEMQRAQDLNDHAGSIMRLHDDGRVPRDNPFVGRRGAKPEIYAYGVRNPQGMTLHPDTGAVWEHEHGARGGDEINVIRPGRNYGWPVITHGVGYSGLPIGKGITHQEGMEQPLHHWTPSIAPSGMSFYTGDAFPGWRGNLFVGALVQRHLARLVIDGEKVLHQERLLDGRYRIRDVRQGPDGMLWLLTDHRSGQVLRLEPMTDR
ncbi:MAG: PQQ-dependent sugar dehydrogenase [Ectothiorhodospiraceae bacterium]|nr:PQQ-dependent sugar dehydrogenase [Ectothiorhodospiraceae bacterium]